MVGQIKNSIFFVGPIRKEHVLLNQLKNIRFMMGQLENSKFFWKKHDFLVSKTEFLKPQVLKKTLGLKTSDSKPLIYS